MNTDLYVPDAGHIIQEEKEKNPFIIQIFINQNLLIMALKIKTVARKNPQDPEAPQKYYAQAISSGKVDLEGLCERISQNSTLSEGEIQKRGVAGGTAKIQTEQTKSFEH